MHVRYLLTGIIEFPESSKFKEGVDNQVELPDDKGVILIQPVLQRVSGKHEDEPFTLTDSVAQDQYGVVLGEFDKVTQDITEACNEGSVTLYDLSIGTEFTFRGNDTINRITDVGTRTATFIRLDQEDTRNYNGPPYSITEHVLDEYDLEAIDVIKIDGVNFEPGTSNDVLIEEKTDV